MVDAKFVRNVIIDINNVTKMAERGRTPVKGLVRRK